MSNTRGGYRHKKGTKKAKLRRRVKKLTRRFRKMRGGGCERCNYNGFTTSKETCEQCDGTGSEGGETTCNVCNGRRFLPQKQRDSYGDPYENRSFGEQSYKKQVPCWKCRGTGKISEPCSLCRGRGWNEKHTPCKYCNGKASAPPHAAMASLVMSKQLEKAANVSANTSANVSANASANANAKNKGFVRRCINGLCSWVSPYTINNNA